MSYKIKNRPDIELTEIEILLNKDISDEKVDTLMKDDIGASFFLYINNIKDNKKGLILEHTYIVKFKIYNDKFYPYIDLVFRDPTYIASNELYPSDNTIISFYKSSNSKLLLPIRLDFVITHFQVLKDKKNTENRVYSIRAILNFKNYSENIAYRGTSLKVLQKIAKKCELGFLSNIDNTDDEMLWINTNKYNSDFINDITKHSYLDDNSILYSFIDLYYALNYMDIGKQLLDDTFKQTNIWTLPNLIPGDEDKEIVTPLLITNHPNMIGSNSFIVKYYINNDPRDINWDIGYTSYNYTYNKTENNCMNTEVEQQIDNDITDKMIMKSLDKELYNKKNYIGKQDNDNVHSNYLIAMKHNENNLRFLTNSKMTIIIYTTNMSLYRLQLVEVVIYELANMKKMNVTSSTNDGSTDNDSESDSYRINNKISGKWLIIGINYTFNKGEISQEVSLVRRYMNNEYDKEKLDDFTKRYYKDYYKTK